MSQGKSNGSFWKIFAGIAVSAIFVWLALRNIDFKALGQTLLRVNPVWLVVAGGLVFLSYYTRAMLWQTLLKSQQPTRRWNLFRIVTIGYFANNLLPLKIGELIRAWLLSKKENLSASVGLATVVLERGMDMVALLLYFCLAMTLVPFERWLKLSGLAVVVFGVVFVLVVLLNYRFGGHLLDALERPLQKLPGNAGRWLHVQLGNFLEGLKLITSLGQIARVVGLALVTWMCWIGVTYACFLALGMKLPFAAAIFLIVVLNFGLMIPSSPGGLGVFEFMVILALGRYGVAKEQALGVGFTFHMLQYILTFVAGWVFALQMNVSMFQWGKDSAELAPAPEPEP